MSVESISIFQGSPQPRYEIPEEKSSSLHIEPPNKPTPSLDIITPFHSSRSSPSSTVVQISLPGTPDDSPSSQVNSSSTLPLFLREAPKKTRTSIISTSGNIYTVSQQLPAQALTVKGLVDHIFSATDEERERLEKLLDDNKKKLRATAVPTATLVVESHKPYKFYFYLLAAIIMIVAGAYIAAKLLF